jgi:hypothetical protein
VIILESAIVTLRRFRHTSSIAQSSSSSYISLNTSLRSCSVSISTSVCVELIVSRMKGEVMTSTKYKCVVDAFELIHFDGILLLSLLHLLVNYTLLYSWIYTVLIIIIPRYLSYLIYHNLNSGRYRISSLSCHLPISLHLLGSKPRLTLSKSAGTTHPYHQLLKEEKKRRSRKRSGQRRTCCPATLLNASTASWRVYA